MLCTLYAEKHVSYEEFKVNVLWISSEWTVSLDKANHQFTESCQMLLKACERIILFYITQTMHYAGFTKSSFASYFTQESEKKIYNFLFEEYKTYGFHPWTVV